MARRREAKKVVERPKTHAPCMYAGCTMPGQWKVSDTLFKCEDHYKADRANPWGSVARVYDDGGEP